MTATDPAEVREPWLPVSLRGEGYRSRSDSVGVLSYVVVDELIDDTATLAISRWPEADGYGHLRFDHLGERRHVGVAVAALRENLYARARPPIERSPRIGDVFAAQLTDHASDQLATGDDVEWEHPLTELLADPIYDVTAEAREVAKLASYAAAADILEEAEANRRGLLDPGLPDETATDQPPSAPPTTVPSAVAWEVPADLVGPPDPAGFVAACKDDNDGRLVYFVLNVGDGDSQLLLLPSSDGQGRRGIVVDIATVGKLPRLLAALRDPAVGLLPADSERALLPLVVATHPHDDHIGGLPQLLSHDDYGGEIQELWEPGYYHTTDIYVETMVQLEARRHAIRHLQPTSGLTYHLDQTRITVVGPGIGLRNRFDSYGTQINDASLALKVEFPFTRIIEQAARDASAGLRDRNRLYVRSSPWSLLLGADAQTTAWAQATVDFPQLHSHHNRALARELRLGTGGDSLRAHVFKVPHHASKHGLNLELVSRIKPDIALISCRAGGRHGFPHHLAVESLREARMPIASRGGDRPSDHDLGIHYTCAHTPSADGDGENRPLGSLALILSPKRRTPAQLWRFQDAPQQHLDLANARRMNYTHLSPIRKEKQHE